MVTSYYQEQLRLYELFKILFIETNPGPVKYAADLMNIMNNNILENTYQSSYQTCQINHRENNPKIRKNLI